VCLPTPLPAPVTIAILFDELMRVVPPFRNGMWV
jgi:hypothetical protein